MSQKKLDLELIACDQHKSQKNLDEEEKPGKLKKALKAEL